MSDIQKDLNLSNHQTYTLAEDIRLASGSRSIIESNLKQNLHEINHQLDNFRHSRLRFIKEIKGQPTESFEQTAIICDDVDSLIGKVIESRNYLDEEDVLVRIGLDGGGGFMKVCLSIFDMKMPSTGKTLSKKFLDSVVKRVFILALVPDIQENYYNVKKLWITTHIHLLERPFTIATDLKLCNILLGLMSHSALHPCCWCNIDKHNLHKIGTQRTIANLRELFWSYYGAGVSKAKAKDFGNAIHPSMVTGIDDTPILHIVPPPELHLLIGPVNTLYDSLNNIRSDSELCLSACNVKKTEYHGGSFAGNDSRKLLKRTDVLKEMCPLEFKNYVETFKYFNEVVGACYGRELEHDYQNRSIYNQLSESWHKRYA